MIASQNQGESVFAYGLIYHLPETRTRLRDLRKKARPLRSDGGCLCLGNGHVSEILHLIAERCDPFIQPGETQGGRTHIYTTPAGSQIHWCADDRNAALPHAAYGLVRYSIRG